MEELSDNLTFWQNTSKKTKINNVSPTKEKSENTSEGKVVDFWKTSNEKTEEDKANQETLKPSSNLFKLINYFGYR